MNILDQILADKRERIAELKVGCSMDYLKSVAHLRVKRAGLAARLRVAPMGLIAEVKRKSPSAGTLRDPFEPGRIAERYQAAGAQAISVLMDEKYFGGGITDMAKVRDATSVPLLYKEFVVDEWQVWQAASVGASAVLLIAAALDGRELKDFLGMCDEAGLEALVEVHNEHEMKRAVEARATCIGVNNRDLRTFDVSLGTSLSLAGLAPEECTLVSESGIKTAGDIQQLREAGYHAVLVGEHLLRQDDIEAAVRELMGAAWASS